MLLYMSHRNEKAVWRMHKPHKLYFFLVIFVLGKGSDRHIDKRRGIGILRRRIWGAFLRFLVVFEGPL